MTITITVTLSASYHDQLHFLFSFVFRTIVCMEIVSFCLEFNMTTKEKFLLFMKKKLLNTRCESFSLQYFWEIQVLMEAVTQVCDSGQWSGVSQYSISLCRPLWPCGPVACSLLWCVNHTLDTSLLWGDLIGLTDMWGWGAREMSKYI